MRDGWEGEKRQEAQRAGQACQWRQSPLAPLSGAQDGQCTQAVEEATVTRDPQTIREIESAIITVALEHASAPTPGRRRAAWNRLQQLKLIKEQLTKDAAA